jgi:hypothetical protein
MSLYLLDSGIVIDVLNGKRGRLELTDRLSGRGAILASCPTTITEVYAGLRREEGFRTDRILRSLKFFPLTWEISKLAGDLLMLLAAERTYFILTGYDHRCRSNVASDGIGHRQSKIFSDARDQSLPTELNRRHHGHYSCRRACMGWIATARRAGNHDASSAATERVTVTPINAAGSFACHPET